LSFVEHGLAHLEPYVAAYGALALFAIVYLESLGAPLPGESALVAAAALAVRGDLSVVHVLLAAFSGAVLGDSTGYLIGRVGGRPLLMRFGPRVGLTPERYARFSKLMRRRGAWVVMTARFVVVLRQLNGLLAGAMMMPWPVFAAANAAGAALWTGAWVLGVYVFGTRVL
jgi:membrane protein DedA with SNARE-associated domain